ncbi:MAG: oxidoreductase [Acidobacteria bacterium]|nr:oxidoreductase [Acidobacteriota bacterium]
MADNSQKLKGKVAVVTGSTQGIGAGIARMFALSGARVVVHGRNRERGEAVAAAIRETGGEAVLVLGDMRQENDCRNLIRKAEEHFGRLDVLVNNAALVHRGNIDNTSLELWDKIFEVNLRAVFLCCQEAVKVMRKNGKNKKAAVNNGSIVNIGSVNAYVGQTKLLAYSASKGGLMTFTRNLATHLAQDRIRVNQLNVGWTLTEGEVHVQSVEEERGEEWLEDALKTRPFGRLLTPEDVAFAALYFACEQSALVTGTIMDLEQYPVGAPPPEMS